MNNTKTVKYNVNVNASNYQIWKILNYFNYYNKIKIKDTEK